MSEVRGLSRRKAKREKPSAVKNSLMKTAMNVYEIPEIGLPFIQARGNKEFCIEGCKGIIEYDAGRIKLNTGKMSLTLEGENLVIGSFSDIQTVISGNIITVSFDTDAEE